MPVKRWRVMGYDTFARESYCVGEYASEAEARAELERQRRLLAATRGNPNSSDISRHLSSGKPCLPCFRLFGLSDRVFRVGFARLRATLVPCCCLCRKTSVFRYPM